ncbi:MAG: sulfite exporter TauE/SafE family protein [Chloroflexi bacterium]|nr:sulfite exporter TauE/SafE family protein [Chloroflexota bacterium]
MILDVTTAWNLVLVGFGVGVLVGLTGVGGGAIMTPLLIVLFRLPPSIAIGTDLVNAALMKAVGAYQHWRQGTVKLPIVRALALGSLPAAVLGVGLVKVLKDLMGSVGENVLTLILAWTLVLVAGMMMYRVWSSWYKSRTPVLTVSTAATRDSRQAPRHRGLITAILGFVAGTLVSLTSVGAGSIIMVVLVSLYSASAKRLVGTDIVHAALLASVAAAGHMWAGNVDLSVASALLIGSVPGVLVGSRLSVRMPDKLLRVMLALTLMVTGVRLIVG